jgi:hypothetical protein
MKKDLSKIYNIFQQIDKLNGSTGWDQTGNFYHFYENDNFLVCWELLYGLICENKEISLNKFGVNLTLSDLRKLAKGKSSIYDFNSGNPQLITQITRNGKNQPIGTVTIDNPITGEIETLEFVDGIKVSEDVVENKKDPQLIAWEKSYLKNENPNLSLQWVRSLGGDINWLQNLKKLLDSKNVTYEFFETFLINVDKLTSKEIEDLDYVEDRIDTHLEDAELIENDGLGNYTEYEIERMNDENIVEKYPIFRIDGEIPETLESLDQVEAFLNYLYDDCALLGIFHPDDSFDNYVDENNEQIFTKVQQEKYSKYMDDMFELDADGDSEFVKAGYEDVYDYCMNYRNNNYGINENYPIKLNYGCTYIRRDGTISGILELLDESKKDIIFYDHINMLNYKANGRLYTGEYNRLNPLDLIKENLDFVSYLEDGKLCVGISFPVLPTKYPSSLNFVSDELGGFVSYIYFERNENTTNEIENFGLKVKWNEKLNSWEISSNSGYYDLVEFIAINSTDELTSTSGIIPNFNDSLEFLIKLNNIEYWCSLSKNESFEENHFNAEFYILTKTGELNDSTFIGDCEIVYDDFTSRIESIDWTLPEYENEIDPLNELNESLILSHKILELN